MNWCEPFSMRFVELFVCPCFCFIASIIWYENLQSIKHEGNLFSVFFCRLIMTHLIVHRLHWNLTWVVHMTFCVVFIYTLSLQFMQIFSIQQCCIFEKLAIFRNGRWIYFEAFTAYIYTHWTHVIHCLWKLNEHWTVLCTCPMNAIDNSSNNSVQPKFIHYFVVHPQHGSFDCIAMSINWTWG